MAFNGSPAGYNSFPISCLDSTTDNQSLLYGGMKIQNADNSIYQFTDKDHLTFTTSASNGAQILINDASGIGLVMTSLSGAGLLQGGYAGLHIQSLVEPSGLTDALVIDASGNLTISGTTSSITSNLTSSGANVFTSTNDFTAGTVTVATVAQSVIDNTVASTSYVQSAVAGATGFDVNAPHTWGAVQTFNYPLAISWSRTYGGTGYLGYNSNVTTYDATVDGINSGAFIINHGIYSVFTNLTCTILAGSSISSIVSTIRTGSRTGAIVNNSVNIYPVTISGNATDIKFSISNSTCGYLGSDLYCVVTFTVPSGNYQDSLSNIAVNTSFTRVS
jgi:hypothetical protein